MIGSYPIASAPIAAPFGDSLVAQLTAFDTLSLESVITASSIYHAGDGFTLSEVLTMSRLMGLAESFTLSDSNSISAVYALAETLALSDAFTAKVLLTSVLTEGLSLTTAIHLLAQALAVDGFDLADTSAANRRLLLDAAAVLALATGATSTLEVAIALAESLSLRDAVAYVAQLSASETIDLADALSTQIRAWLEPSEGVTLGDTAQPTLVFLLDDGLALGDTGTLNVSVLLHADDAFAFIANLPLGDENFAAWVMNADTTGVTTYSQFPMNSLMTLDGITYGLTDTGLYELSGDTDDGEPIDAWMATGDIDFGTSREKNVPRCYLYQTQGGALVLKTISSRHGRRAETYYELALRDPTDDTTVRRVPLGRGVRGVTWRFELHNVDGADLDLSGAEVLPVVLSRRG